MKAINTFDFDSVFTSGSYVLVSGPPSGTHLPAGFVRAHQLHEAHALGEQRERVARPRREQLAPAHHHRDRCAAPTGTLETKYKFIQ